MLLVRIDLAQHMDRWYSVGPLLSRHSFHLPGHRKTRLFLPVRRAVAGFHRLRFTVGTPSIPLA